MQTSYATSAAIALEGQPHGEIRSSHPRHLPWTAAVYQVRFTAGGDATDVVWTITDDLTGQVYSVTSTGSATEATMLDNALAALTANAKTNSLFSFTEDGVDDVVATARHANRAYTIVATGGPSAVTAPATSTVTAPGGAGLEMGLCVAKGAGEFEMSALGAADTVSAIAGILLRTEANHFHKLENELPTDVDTLARGGTYAVADKARIWVRVEDSVTIGGPIYVRRALTSAAGRVGAFRATPAGSAQVNTFAPTVDQGHYAFGFGFAGVDYAVHYQPTDATTAVADAIDGLYDAVLAVLTDAGIETLVVPTESDTLLTLTTAAGYALSYLRPIGWALDTEATNGVAVLGAADVDAIDVSSVMEYETAASAGGLARVRVNL